jgi:hypothetical protein
MYRVLFPATVAWENVQQYSLQGLVEYGAVVLAQLMTTAGAGVYLSSKWERQAGLGERRGSLHFKEQSLCPLVGRLFLSWWRFLKGRTLSNYPCSKMQLSLYPRNVSISIDTIDYVHGIGNMPTHSIDFNAARPILVMFESLSRSSKLAGNFF